MPESYKTIVWFNEVNKDDVPLVGGKGANLGEMTRAQIPVPPGFIVTATAYFDTTRVLKVVLQMVWRDSARFQNRRPSRVYPS